MEQTPFQKLTKPETNKNPNNRRRLKQRHPDSPAAGQVTFRLLCHVHTAGGVIGSSGSIIKHLETLTGSKIRLEDGIPKCRERVVNIIGDAVLEKKISVGDREEDVSRAQVGLIKVFERVLEVQENEDNNEFDSNGSIECRLLAQTGQIGSLMGKGGKIVDMIRKRSGAEIRVLKKDQNPPCAGPEEELIQIKGGSLAVKKALLAVSRCLQYRALGELARGCISPHGVLHNFHTEFSPKIDPAVLSFAVDDCSVGHSLSADVEIIHNVEEDSSMRKVVFRFLCSNAIAGGVIGKGANVVKSLEKETGASITFASPVSGSKERVAIISSLENLDPLHSPAQIAIVRVFARCIDVGVDQGMISSIGHGQCVSARILVASSQLSSVLDEDGRVASDISTTSGAEMQLMGVDALPNCAGLDDNVVQISGDYENVKSALFQLAGRLRETFFSGTGPQRAGCRRSSYSTKHETNVENEGPKQKVEVVIPKEVFGSVYGENGSNLACLREISGATVVLKDPRPGESTGKVIILGTTKRVQIAQSLIQAFISL